MTEVTNARDSSLREGDLLAGKYRIAKILGAGGMGTVVAAHHIHLDEKVAIKVLHPEVVGNREALGRFAREARAAAKIKSEHVVRVIDVGSLENGAPYIVLEYLDGGDLDDYLAQRSVLDVEEAIEYVLQALEAIAEAHSLGIIHRDLKPANLFRARRADGSFTVKVLDFGISKVSGSVFADQDMTITKTATVMGSPLYMSPEQLGSSRDVDVRADIWSLGVIMYELLAGTVPFSGASFSEICVRIVTNPLPPLCNGRGDLPSGLERVIARCLEKDRANRFNNVAELALALAPFASSRARISVDRIVGVLREARLAKGNLNENTPVGEHIVLVDGPDTVNPWGRTKPTSVPKRPKVFWWSIAMAVLFVPLGLVGIRWWTILTRRGVGPNITASISKATSVNSLILEPVNNEMTIVMPLLAEPSIHVVSSDASPLGAMKNPHLPDVSERRVSTPKTELFRARSRSTSDNPKSQRLQGTSEDTSSSHVVEASAVTQPIKRDVYEDRK